MDQLIPCNTAAEGKISSLGYLKYSFHNPIFKKSKVKIKSKWTEAKQEELQIKGPQNPETIEPTYALSEIKS